MRRVRRMVRVSAVALADLSARRRVPPSCLEGYWADLLPACPPAPVTLMTASDIFP